MRLLVDLVIAFTLAEAAVLALRHHLTRRGASPGRVLPNLASGLFLLLALRISLGGDDGLWIGACLGASGIAHALDMRARRGR